MLGFLRIEFIMLIFLVTHIVIAVSGLVFAALSLFTLSQKMISLSYVLTAGTIATGTVLVFTAGNVLKSCLSGLFYLSTVLMLTSVAKHRLAANEQEL